jgi:spore coat protein H
MPSGHIKLNLQAEWRDPSLMREKISYDVMKESGCMTGDAEWIHFERNGEFIGVFTSVEQIDEHFLEIREKQGSIWKVEYGNFQKQKHISNYYPQYILEVGQFSDYKYLSDFIEVVNDVPDGEFRTAILEYLDIQQFLNFYSAQSIISGWDFINRNYYLFRDLENGLFKFLPWDLNTSWSNCEQPIDIGTFEHPRIRNDGSIVWNRLFDRLMTTPQFRRMYSVRLEEILNGPLNLSTILYSLNTHHAFLRPEVNRDQYKKGWESIELFDQALSSLTTFARNRRYSIFQQLASFKPNQTVNLFLNEALQLNVNGIMDEGGDHDPWVEIYNFGNETISLDGLWLSDEPDYQLKWPFPPDIAVKPGGFELVWLDSETDEGPLHANFRLDSDTRYIILSREDETEVDRFLLPGYFLPDVPVARIPDTAVYTTLVSLATPLATNDPTPLTELSLSTDLEYLPGDTVSLVVTVTNHREFYYSLDLDITYITPWYERPFDNMAVPLEPYSIWKDTLQVKIPSDVSGFEVVIIGALKNSKDRMLDRAEILLYVRDPNANLLVVNEIMADNDTTVTDESDQFDDWIEIYNPGECKIHMHGLYLSDDGEDPDKWPFPDVSIKPNGHMVIWCDDDTEQGPLHTNFKLDADGEEIGLYDLDIHSNNPIDVIQFDTLDDDEAYGRSPDGSDNVVFLPFATPGAPNP